MSNCYTQLKVKSDALNVVEVLKVEPSLRAHRR